MGFTNHDNVIGRIKNDTGEENSIYTGSAVRYEHDPGNNLVTLKNLEC